MAQTVKFKEGIKRRDFVKILGAGSAVASFVPVLTGKAMAQSQEKKEKPATNIDDAKKIPRSKNSMPGKYPGKVVQTVNEKAIADKKINYNIVYNMLKNSMLALTGASNIKDAWQQFVEPNEVIGLKVNPVAGKQLSTSLEITKVVIAQMKEAGVPDKNIVIWDRREFALHEIGIDEKSFPGIKIAGTEIKDKDGSFYDKDGKQYGEKMIDKDWYFYADCEQKYDAETLPYMINEGKYSYFSKIVTQQVDKIINIPILKNAGASVTLCLKNLAYGAITNTARLHKPLWSETCAQVPAFAPLRDKVVLNIVDGIVGCYDGGPGANPQFICNYNTLLVGTDPVAVDRVGYDIVLKKRMAEKVQKVESPRGRAFMKLAAELGLGEEDINKIDWVKV